MLGTMVVVKAQYLGIKKCKCAKIQEVYFKVFSLSCLHSFWIISQFFSVHILLASISYWLAKIYYRKSLQYPALYSKTLQLPARIKMKHWEQWPLMSIDWEEYLEQSSISVDQISDWKLYLRNWWGVDLPF